MGSRSSARLAATVAVAFVFALASLLHSPSATAGAPAAGQGTEPASVVTAKAICGNWKGAVAGYGSWATSTSSCSFWSSSSPASKPAKWGYSWTIPPYSNGRICVQGLGYIWDATKKKTVAKWYSMGCGTSGSGSVPWRGKPYKVNGKTFYMGVAATPKVRAKVQLGFLGAAYSWRG